MELLYIWIKDYKNIQNQGFNFSPRWWFEYDVISGILNIDDIIEDVIGDFFGNNIANVTAIIGENGVGKSNLFEFILSKLKDKTGFWDDEFIIIFKDSNKGKIWLHEDLEFFLSYDNKNEFDFEVNSFKMQERDEFGVRGGFNSPNEIDSLQLIYITDAFEGNVKYGGLVNRNFIDMSTDRLVNSSRELSNQLQIKENVFKYEEIKRQAKFLGYFATNLDSVQDIIIPDYLEITSSFRQILKNISAFQKENRNSILLEDERSIIDYFQNKPIYDQVYCELVLSAIYEAMITSSVGEQAFKYFVEKISLLKNDEGYEFIDMGEKIYLISYTEILKFVKSLQDNDRIKIDKGHNSFALPMENVGEFFTTIDSIGYQGRNPFLRYDWQYANAYKYGKLSTGEKALVNLFSRLFVLRHKLLSNQTILLFIDEGELAFHPRFQKKYLNSLVKNIPIILFCAAKNLKVQIILTSHSPFLVSDLPKENIIFLSKDSKGRCQVADGLNEKKQTFAANIHTLLTDSFFMDGLIGAFAEDKINQVISFLNDYPNNKELTLRDAKKIVNMIGEPILKKHLQQQIKLIEIGKATKNEEDIEALKQRIAELEIALKNTNEN